MSSEATRFVTDHCDDVPPQLRYTLLAAATWAGPDGRGIRVSANTLHKATGKSLRQIKRDIADLKKLGMLVEGDQSLTAHLPIDVRPVVYDIGPMLALASVTQLGGRKKVKRSDAPCDVHAGQKAATCGPCRSERIAGTA